MKVGYKSYPHLSKLSLFFPSLIPSRMAGRMKPIRRSRAERSEEKEDTPTVRSRKIYMPQKVFRIFTTFILWGLALFLFLSGIMFVRQIVTYAANSALSLPQPKIEEKIGQSSKLYDREDNFLYEIHGAIRRQNVNLPEIPINVRNAFLVAEDKDFYQHPGFSIKRIISALITDLRNNEIEQGASTIPQQLARKLVLSQEKTLDRKVKEIFISYLLTLRYSKDQIFERYLNEVSVGGNLVGVRTASEVYFQKAPQELTLAEGATLAALINAPSNLSPYFNRSGLEERAHYILEEMSKEGLINRAEYEDALGQEINYASNIEPVKYPYFVFFVRDYLFQKYGEETIESGGWRITTSLDPHLQELGEQIIKEQVARNTSAWGASNACLIVLDPKNGEILAMVGGKDFGESEVNVTTSARQPGSAIKPFIYLTAFEEGFAPETLILDKIQDFGGGYRPTDYGGGATGSWWSAREALVQSLNIPAVATLNRVGIEKTATRLKSLGFSTIAEPQNYGLSLALGTAVIKPIDMAQGLGIIANGGHKINQQPILKITDSSGSIVEDNSDFKASEEIIDSNIAAMIASILSDYKTKARFYNQAWYNNYTLKDRPAAAKTGTSEGPKDTWTVGFTSNLVAVVWAGNNDGSPINKKSGADGINVAAPIWHEFMEKALTGQESEPFPSYEKPVLDQNHRYISSN